MPETRGVARPLHYGPAADESFVRQEEASRKSVNEIWRDYFGVCQNVMAWRIATSHVSPNAEPNVPRIADSLLMQGDYPPALIRDAYDRWLADQYVPAAPAPAAVRRPYVDPTPALERLNADLDPRGQPVCPQEPRSRPEDVEVAPPPTTRQARRAAFAAEHGLNLPPETPETRRARHIRAKAKRLGISFEAADAMTGRKGPPRGK